MMTIYSPFRFPGRSLTDNNRPSRAALTFTLVLIAFASACSKKTPIPPPPPPTPTANSPATNTPAGPGTPVTAEFTVEPSTIERGQSAVLRWNVTGSNNVAISNGLGTVEATGTRRITPPQTTSYVLTASGTAGDASATATVTVTGPAAPPPPVTRPGRTGTLESRVQSDLQDALYDYDSNNIRDDAPVRKT